MESGIAAGIKILAETEHTIWGPFLPKNLFVFATRGKRIFTVFSPVQSEINQIPECMDVWKQFEFIAYKEIDARHFVSIATPMASTSTTKHENHFHSWNLFLGGPKKQYIGICRSEQFRYLTVRH